MKYTLEYVCYVYFNKLFYFIVYLFVFFVYIFNNSHYYLPMCSVGKSTCKVQYTS